MDIQRHSNLDASLESEIDAALQAVRDRILERCTAERCTAEPKQEPQSLSGRLRAMLRELEDVSQRSIDLLVEAYPNETDSDLRCLVNGLFRGAITELADTLEAVERSS